MIMTPCCRQFPLGHIRMGHLRGGHVREGYIIVVVH